ncbi:InlB B-repeat-containing protein [Mycoplasmatota bacterium]|nr:InlB B-repeat-containing protein [Mycoplasmatota bacterium]
MKKIIGFFIFSFVLFLLLGCDELNTGTNMPITDITLTDSVTIIFETNGGSLIDDLVITQETEAIDLPSTTKEGFTFEGWYFDSDLTENFTNAQPNLSESSFTLYAKWEPITYTFVFDVNGGNSVDDLVFAYDAPISLPTPLKVGYNFLGWFKDEDLTVEFDPSASLEETEINLYAKWELITGKVTIKPYFETFTLGEYTIGDTEVIEEAAGVDYTHTPELYAGFTFDSDNENNLLTVNVLDDDTSVIEVYYNRKLVTVTYETNANISVTASQGLYDSLLNEPQDPLRVGYDFVDWYSDTSLMTPYVFDKYPAEDITLYAKWVGVPSSIYFNTSGGDSIPELVQNTGTNITLPIPTRTGYDFIDWYESPLLQTTFTDLTMPAGLTTVYAKWQAKTYTISYHTDGGSTLSETDHVYGQTITLADDPSKTNYIFGGWFLDQSLETSFDYLTMPANDFTLYAKWIDASDPYSILLNTTKDHLSSVTLRGIVYAKHHSTYMGYYLGDHTGIIYVDGSNTSINIGDELEISATLLFDDFGQPYLQGPVVTPLNTDQVSRSPKTLTYSEYDILDDYVSQYVSEIFTIQGIVYNESGNYFLIDPVSLVKIPISLKSLVSETDLQTYENLHYQSKFVLVYEGGTYKAVLIDLVEEMLTEDEKLHIVKNIIINHLVKTSYLEGQNFDLPEIDMFAYANISYSASVNGSLYDETNKIFLDVSEDQTLTFQVTLTSIISGTLTFNLDVLVKPIHITSIAGMLSGDLGAYYQIQGVVVSRGDGNIIVLKDSTGFVFVHDPFFLEVGDEVILNVKKQLEEDMVLITSENDGLYLTTFVESGVELALSPEEKTVSEMLELDLTDPSIYGKYYEIRGYLLPELGEYHNSYHIVVGEEKIPITSYTYAGFENLMDHEYLEVIVRVYLVSGENGPILYYEGIRQDIRIPDYTDQELVDTIYQIFLYMFADQEFDAYDPFYLYPYHPQLGGEISWTLDSVTEAVYDYENQQFLYDFVDTPLSFTIEISKGTSSKTIDYQTILHKIEPVSFDYFHTLDRTYGSYYLQGLVVYWHPYFSYIMDEFGNIVIVEDDLEGVKKGDEVLLYLDVSYRYDYSIFFEKPYDKESSLIAIISRDNPIEIDFTPMDVLSLQSSDFTDLSLYHHLIEIEGKLIKLDEYHLAIESAYGLIHIDTADSHTYFNLTQYEDQYISIRAFIFTYDSDDGSIVLRYIGRESDLSPISYMDIDKLNIVKDYILDVYQEPMIGDIDFNFSQVYDIFDEGTFTFEVALDQPASIIDIPSDYINSVTEISLINIDVDIVIGGASDSFTMTMTVLPAISKGSIADLKTNIGQTYRVLGQVIAVTKSTYNTYVLMVQGEGGVVFVHLNHEEYYEYYDYNGYVGEIVEITGSAEIVYGKYEVNPDSFKVISRSGTVEIGFQETDISALLTLNIFDDSIYGSPYQITGLVEKEDGNHAELYYINDGVNRILITSNELYYGILYHYIGYEVTLKGFVYGVNQAFDIDEMTLIVNHYKYDETNSIMLSNLTDQDVVDIIIDNIWSNYQDNYMSLNPGDTGSYLAYVYEPISSSYPDAKITPSVKTGADYIEFYNDYFIAKMLTEDAMVEILMTVDCGIASKTVVLTYKINGYTLSAFTDLFSLDLGTEEIVLEAELMLSGWGYHYFLINGDIYYLETKAYMDAYPGQLVLLTGKKNIIDGIPDYTYDISVIDLDDYPYSVLETTSSVTINDLYINDYDVNPLQRDYLQVYGILGYDPYLELYTLSDGDEIVYVRYSDYYSYEDYLQYYVGYPILLDVFLPMQYILGEYMLVDTFGTTSNFEIAPLLDVEALDLSENYIEMYFENLQVQAGSLIFDFPKTNDATSANYSYSLVNTSDSQWVDLVNETTNITDILRVIQLEVLIELDSSTETRTVLVSFDLLANETLTVKEALYAPYNELIQVQGIVTYINEEYLYMMISNSNYNYLVSLDTSIDSLFDMANVQFALGDEVRLIGWTDYFQESEYIVYMSDLRAVEVINSTSSYTLTPEIMTFQDLMFMDYLDPMNYFKYVSVEETLTWNQSSIYPSYQITDHNKYVEEYAEYFDIEIIPNVDIDEFHNIINPYVGDTLTIEGFIFLESIYVDFYFSIAMTDYQNLNE